MYRETTLDKLNKNFNKEVRVSIDNVKKIEKTELYKLKNSEQLITLLLFELIL